MRRSPDATPGMVVPGMRHHLHPEGTPSPSRMNPAMSAEFLSAHAHRWQNARPDTPGAPAGASPMTTWTYLRLLDSPTRVVPPQQVAGAAEAGLVAQSAEYPGAKGGVQVVLDRVLAEVVAVADLRDRQPPRPQAICRCRLVSAASAGANAASSSAVASGPSPAAARLPAVSQPSWTSAAGERERDLGGTGGDG